jgi:CelD/BcsL family acetyltransferase involved in cellulose biosynthesis
MRGDGATGLKKQFPSSKIGNYRTVEFSKFNHYPSPLLITTFSTLESAVNRLAAWTQFAELELSSPLPPFFTPLTWIAWYLAHPNSRPLIFELKNESGEIQALFPAYRSGNRVQLVTDQHLDYQDILAVSETRGVELFSEVVQYCTQENLTLELAKISESSALYRIIRNPEIKAIASVESRFWSSCPFCEFPVPENRNHGGADLLSQLSKKRRKNFKAAASRLRKEFPNYELSHLKGEEIKQGLPEIAAVHSRNQFRKDGESVFLQPGFLEFLENQAAAGNGLTLSILRTEAEGEIIAFNLGYFSENTYFYYIPSYEGKYSHLSPGSWLLIETLRHHYQSARPEHGPFTFDLLSGAESYKKNWSTESYQIYRALVFPKKINFLPRWFGFWAVYQLKGLKNRIRAVG